MTSNTFITIQETIKFAMIEYILFIIEEHPDVIHFNMLSVPLNYQDIAGEYLIYETLFINQNFGFERFCKDNDYFSQHDNAILNEYVLHITGTNFNLNIEIIPDFFWILRLCVNTLFYKIMANHEFIDIWNQLNYSIVRNNILK